MTNITTDVKPEMIPGIQTRNEIPHDKYNIRIIAHASTNWKDNLSLKDDLYIAEAHTAMDMFRYAVFFIDASWGWAWQQTSFDST